MTYETERSRLGRRPMRIVELALDAGTETFCDGEVPRGEAMLGIVEDIDLAPTRLRPGKGIGERGTVSVKLRDFAVDGGGTYLGRMIGANTYYLNRAMTIRLGYIAQTGYDAGDFSSRVYYIESIDGPDDRGLVVVKAKDALQRLHDSGAVMPKATKGKLVGSLAAGFTGLVDVGNVDNFPASGHAIIEKEIVAYDSISGTSINVTARGEFGSLDADHDADDPARAVWAASSVNVVDAIEEALTDFADVPSGNIPSADWAAEKADYLALHSLTGVIPEPRKVKDVVNAWCEASSINLFWDERDQEIKIAAYGPQLVADFVITDGTLLDGRTRVKRDLKERISQVWYFFNKRDHSKKDDADNFKDLQIEADLSLEDPAAYGLPAVRQIKAEFITSSAVASATGGRLLERFKHGRTKLSFALDASEAAIWTGDVGLFTSELLQNADGSEKSVQIIITSAQEIDGHRVKYEAEIFKLEPPVKYCRIAATSTPDYTLASASETGRYGFIADATPELSNGDEAYYIA